MEPLTGIDCESRSTTRLQIRNSGDRRTIGSAHSDEENWAGRAGQFPQAAEFFSDRRVVPVDPQCLSQPLWLFTTLHFVDRRHIPAAQFGWRFYPANPAGSSGPLLVHLSPFEDLA